MQIEGFDEGALTRLAMAVVDTLIQTSVLLRGLRVTMAFSNPLPGTYLGAPLSCSAPVAVGVSEPTNQ